MTQVINPIALKSVCEQPFPDIEMLKTVMIHGINVEAMEAQTSGIEVSDNDSARLALSMSLQARKINQTLEQSRKEVVKPHLDYQRAIGKIVKDVQDRLESIEIKLKGKIDKWIETEKDNPFGRVDEIEVEDGKIYITKKWTFDVESEDQVPREYMMPDEDYIQDQINQGVRNIKGVRIYEQEKTTMRVKN